MRHQWLSIFSFLVITIIVLAFFRLYLQPIENPESDEQTTTQETLLTEPTVSFVNPKKGALEPKVTLIEFGDFECAACKTVANAIDIVLRTEPSVQVVWKNLPNESAHELATPAAIAAHCAYDQGTFWEFHDELYSRQTFLSEDQFFQIAQELELDTAAFENCYLARETLPLVKKDFDEALALGLTATPTIFIGEERFVGSVSSQELLTAVRQALSSQP